MKNIIRIIALLLLPLNAWAALSTSISLASGAPASIFPGATTVLEVIVGNSNNANPIASTAFTLSLPGTHPDGLIVSGAAIYTCTDGDGNNVATAGTLTAVLGADQVTLANGVIPVRSAAASTDGICTIQIPVEAGTTTGSSATYSSGFASGAVTGNDGAAVSNTGAVAQTIGVLQMARPVIEKTMGPTNVRFYIGDTRPLVVTISNTNPVPIPNFSFTDNFPIAGASGSVYEVANPLVSSASCNVAGGAPAFSGLATGAFSVTGTGTLPANSICTFSVDVMARNAGGNSIASIVNTINVADFSNDTGVPSAGPASTRIVVESPVYLTKSMGAAYVTHGETATLTLTLGNHSASESHTINTLTDAAIDSIVGVGTGVPGVIGNGLIIVPGSAASTCGGTGAGGVTIAANGDGFTSAGQVIPQNSTCTISVNYTAALAVAGQPISYTNVIPLGGVTVVGYPLMKPGQVSASVLVSDDIHGTKSVVPTYVVPGQPVRYTINVYNHAALARANVTLHDQLPAGQTYLTGTINGINYDPTLSGACTPLTESSTTGDTVVDFTFANLPARTSGIAPGVCTLAFWAQTPAPGSGVHGTVSTNTIQVGHLCHSHATGTPVCNGASFSGFARETINAYLFYKDIDHYFTNITTPAANQPTHPEGEAARVRLRIYNPQANPLTNITLSDSLPVANGGLGGQLQIANPANVSSTCGGTITAVPGSNSFTLNDGTAAASPNILTGQYSYCRVEFDVTAPAGVYDNDAIMSGTSTYADGTTAALVPKSGHVQRVIFTPSLETVKSFNPAVVSSGGISRVTVQLSNVGGVPIINAGVTDNLPAGMVLAPTVNASSTCGGAPAFSSAVPGASTIVMAGANIPGNAACDVQFDVVATGATDWINTLAVGDVTADGGIKNVTPVIGTLLIEPPTEIAIGKATNPSTLTFPGDTSVLTITFTNGNTAVTNVSVDDYFTVDGTSGAALNGMVITPAPGGATTCTGGVVTAVAGGTSVNVSGISMAVGETCTASVNVSSTVVGGIINFIPAGAVSSSQGLTNSGTISTSLTTQSSLGLVKKFTPNVVQPGGDSRLRITFYNSTASPVLGLGVTDSLPAGVVVAAAPNTYTTCTGATVTGVPGSSQVDVAGGTLSGTTSSTAASCYAEIDVIVAAAGDYVNTIPATSVVGTVNGLPVTNTRPATDTLFAKIPLTIHKAINNLTLDAGSPVTFTTGTATVLPGIVTTLTIRIDNANAQALTQARFIDTLPANVFVAPTPGAASTCAGAFVNAPASASSIQVTGATIPASGFCTVSVDLISNIPGDYINAIPSSAITTAEGVSNEEPTSARLVVLDPPGVDKIFVPNIIPPNGTSTLTISFENNNPADITLTSPFSDTLPTSPGFIRIHATPNATTTCPGGLGDFQILPNSNVVVFQNTSVIPSGGCSVSVDVTGATDGVHTNVINLNDLQTTAGNNDQVVSSPLTISSDAYISGRVFNDNSVVPNGTYDNGTDTPIVGSTLNLHAGADCSAPTVDTVVTDALGDYLFTGVGAGTYSVCQPTQPPGTVNGITTAGTITSVSGSTGAVGVASAVTSTPSQIVNIILNGDGGASEVSVSSENNFAEVILSSISGVVFTDLDNNGVQNGSDTPLENVTIELLDAGGAVIATTQTDVNGAYSFDDLAPGTYSVREPNQPADTLNGQTIPGAVPNGGTSGTGTTVPVTPSEISTIILPPNTNASANNFAEVPTRFISGKVFLDQNGNNLQDGSEGGIGGQQIDLTGTDIHGTPVTLSTTTAADGSYSFINLIEGTYTVTQPNQPANTTNGLVTAGSTGGTVDHPNSIISAISLVGGDTASTGNDFSEILNGIVDLTIDKSHSTTGFSSGTSTGFFTISPSNVGDEDTVGTITIVDTLPAGMTAFSWPTVAPWICNVTGQIVNCSSDTVIPASSAGSDIILGVTVAGGIADGTILTNNVVISGGGEQATVTGNNNDDDPVLIQQAASVEGHVWRDVDHDRMLDAGEPVEQGWIVELLLDGHTIESTTTDASGHYSFTGLAPGTGYNIQFREPLTGNIVGLPVPNEQGAAFTNGVIDVNNNPAGADNSFGGLEGLTLVAGTNTVQQSLPLDPSGVVYDSITRLPISGAVVTLLDAASVPVPGACLVGGANPVTTGVSGIYTFLLLNPVPAGCPGNGVYTLQVVQPTGYLPPASTIIPETGGVYVPAGAPGGVDAIQGQNVPPTGGEATTYYFSFNLTVVGGVGVVNNHIPLDPLLGGAIVVTKTTPKTNVVRGELVPYTITATNTLSAGLSNITLQDQIPPGFKYVSGSATINGVSSEPTIAGRSLDWPGLSFTANELKTVQLILIVGAGVSEGKYVNQAWALNAVAAARVSNVATATVRLVPDPLFDCSDLIGKVYDDKNINGYQDEGEPGLAGVRVVTPRGLLITTDDHGRFHIACADVPNELHGSNFMMKLDTRTLPSGYRVTTENPRVVRLTRGKLIKLNFGAALHKVLRVDIDASAFNADGDQLTSVASNQVNELIEILKEQPSQLRLSYSVGADESKADAQARMNVFTEALEELWQECDCNNYALEIEQEVVMPSGDTAVWSTDGRVSR